MIRICASAAKKVPIPGIEYSSIQFGASLEVEVSDRDKPKVIQRKIAALYALLSATIDNQISSAAGSPVVPSPELLPGSLNSHAPVAAASTGSASNGHRRQVMATPAQQRAILALARTLNMDVAQILRDNNIMELSQLTVKDASRVIDCLQVQQAGNPASE